MSLINNFFKKLIFNQLHQLKIGYVTWLDNDVAHFGDSKAELQATVRIDNPKCYRQIALGGSIGAAESYMAGFWQCDDLTSLMRIIIANETILKDLEKGLASIIHKLKNIKLKITKNNIHRAKSNILEHYDLNNDFFSLFLDDTMLYSSAVFHNATEDLNQAQQNKCELICQQLDLQKGEHLLEIGSGWGGLAIYAAKNYGVNVTTTTISDAQFEYVKKKINQLNLNSQITLLKQDYRELTGQYDKLVSIEMIEAVGHQYFETYFRACNNLLKPNGKFLLQSITIQDKEYERYKNEMDFIKAYIFPGGCLPSHAVIESCLENYTSMAIINRKSIGFDYAKTLEIWRERLIGQYDKVKQLGFSDSFINMFNYYFCYCEAGFLQAYIDDYQFLIQKKPETN